MLPIWTPAARPLGAFRALDGKREWKAELWHHLLPADYGWLFCAATSEGYVWSAGQLGAEHGAANLADIQVPIAFLGPGIPRRLVARPVSTVDIAPTLAALLGVRPMERIDGQVLQEVLGHTNRETVDP